MSMTYEQIKQNAEEYASKVAPAKKTQDWNTISNKSCCKGFFYRRCS